MANVQDSTLCSEKTGSQAVSKLLRDVAHDPTATTAIRPHTPWKNKGHLQAFGMRNRGCRVNGCPEMDQKKKTSTNMSREAARFITSRRSRRRLHQEYYLA
ncbi:unnamed protein product [Symbiodinium necroappetens]|uniref:Uncharacterized protein n=1 Tax=Symbiodinium necroappetens TaxID=1628268 RepID=A0A812P883_9DINO|nr:unnamed protein product [Symbiodinium necroappetens]